MLGSFFVPLFGVLLADWLAAGSRHQNGTCSPARGSLGDARGLDRRVRALPVAPSRRPSWWTDALGEGAELGIGATLPSFALAFVLGLAVATLGGRRF